MINVKEYLIELIGEQNGNFAIAKFYGDLNRELRESELNHEGLLENKFLELVNKEEELYDAKVNLYH